MKTGALVLGFHGCDRKTGESLLSGEEFRQSNNPYDWLGNGAYFWENNPKRAMDWAERMKAMPGLAERVKEPFAVGAVINLGNCLDLTEAVSLELIKSAHDSLLGLIEFAQTQGIEGIHLPTNEKAGSADHDLVKRYLDCAVINHLHQLRAVSKLSTFDTVRGAFHEGKELFPGSRIMEKTHIQIAVRSPECIIGVFRIKEHLLK
jgi:hypothetical protein